MDPSTEYNQVTKQMSDEHLEALLDEAIEDTFPASDPIAITVDVALAVHRGERAGHASQSGKQ